MAAANPLPPWVSLYRSVDLEGLGVDGIDEWGEIRCPKSKRKAYGCGERGQTLVDGLTLLACFIKSPNLTSYLRIRLNDQAIHIIQSEFGIGDKPLVKIGNGGMRTRGAVHHSGDNTIVLALSFCIGYQGERIYYLVYDAIGGSLSMVGHVPPYCLSSLTPTALPVRRKDGVDLLVMARLLRTEFPDQGLLHHDVVLCVCPGPSSSCSIGPWQLSKRRYRKQAPKRFYPHVSFSSEGWAFWADLSCGVICCDTRTLGVSSQADFHFIPLPEKLQLDSDTLEVSVINLPEPMEIPVTVLRTMGFGGGSIKLVSIGHSGRPCRRMVTVWDLHRDDAGTDDHWVWRKANRFSVRSLWNLPDFKSVGLPETFPECPVVMPDGAICLLLPNKSKKNFVEDDHICILETRPMRIVSAGRICNYRSAGPILVPSSFIQSLIPLAPSKSKLSSKQAWKCSSVVGQQVRSLDAYY